MRAVHMILLVVLSVTSCSPHHQDTEKLNVFVSILPQKFFVEQIAKDNVSIHVMILPGHSPVIFESTPSQMKEISRADIFFRIGLPFEDAWLKKLQSINPDLEIIDTREGITLRNMDSFDKHHEHSRQKDPHIWLSPKLVKIQSRTICNALQKYDPNNREFYEQNLLKFMVALDSLQKDIQTQLDSLDTRSFLVFHPSWGYFADEFELKQIPIEIEGKSPSPKQMTHILEIVKKEQIDVVFVQKQFSSAAAKAIADAIDGQIIQIDPLAENYLKNMHEIVRIFKSVLDKK